SRWYPSCIIRKSNSQAFRSRFTTSDSRTRGSDCLTSSEWRAIIIIARDVLGRSSVPLRKRKADESKNGWQPTKERIMTPSAKCAMSSTIKCRRTSQTGDSTATKGTSVEYQIDVIREQHL